MLAYRIQTTNCKKVQSFFFFKIALRTLKSASILAKNQEIMITVSETILNNNVAQSLDFI